MLKKAYKGFTLLELMIVVAIIGVLAAVAIPGFMAYIRNSKTAEAKTNLDSIKKGAIAFFEAEHYSPNGLVAITKQYPYADPTAKSVGVGTAPSDKTIGVKTDPTDTKVTKVLNSKVWKELNFSISAPFYYYYTYASVATEVTNDYKPSNKEHPKSTFNAVATASLDSKCDSSFKITGSSNGAVGAVVNNTINGTCSKAAILQEAPKDDKVSAKKD